jgi:hypothetical protein
MVDMGGNAVIILHSCDHTVIEPDFTLFSIDFSGMDNPFCLCFQLLALVVKILISDV